MRRIRLKRYIKSRDQVSYDSVLSLVEGDNNFLGNKFDINKITYNEVRVCMKLLKSGSTYEELFEVFKIFFKVTRKQFFNAYIDQFYIARNFIVNYINDLVGRENKLLKSISVDATIWKQAGGDRLNVFGDLNPLVQLGKIYSIYPQDLKDRPYAEIITLLVQNKTQGEVENNFHRIKSKMK